MAKSDKQKPSAQPRKAASKAIKPATKAAAKLIAKAKPRKTLKPKKTFTVDTLLAPQSSDISVLDRLYAIIEARRDADPAVSHSARLLSRGRAKVAQKFGEEAVECLIEAVAGNHDALVAESADVLYHLLVLWVSSGVNSREVWAELVRREGMSGIAEKASRIPQDIGTAKIP